jgi:hypothetical protein
MSHISPEESTWKLIGYVNSFFLLTEQKTYDTLYRSRFYNNLL